MNFKKLSLGLVLVFILFVLTFEVILCTQRGLPPLEYDPPKFKYNYEEIYKRFFRKIRLSDGTIVYKTQHSQAQKLYFPVHKIKGTRRIFILGGSVAQSFYRGAGYLKKLLESLIPGEKFELIGCGMGGYDSYRELLIHKEILNYKPDFIILLSGHNELYTPVRLNLWAYRLNWLFRNLWIYRDLQEKFLTWSRNRGMMYNVIPQSNRLTNYENNLRTMIRRAKKRNIPMLLCTLPVNFRDCPPPGDAPIWQDKQFFLAWRTLEEGKFEDAIERFKQFLIAYPQDPFGHYFLAKCYDGLGNYSQAQKYYLKTLDLDTKPGDRCSPQRNEVIRRLCAQEDAILADLEKLFIRIAPYGLVGKELFEDNCHWKEKYNSLICEEIIQSISGYFKSHLKSPFASFDKWRYDFVPEQQDFLATMPIDYPKDKTLALGSIFYAITQIQKPYHFEIGYTNERVISFLKIAYQLYPELFDNKTLLKKQLLKEISTNWWMQERLPHIDRIWLALLCHTGEVFRRLGADLKAIEYFNEAIDLNPNLCFFYLGRGLAYYKVGQIDKAKKDFEEITKRPCQHPLIELYRESLGI